MCGDLNGDKRLCVCGKGGCEKKLCLAALWLLLYDRREGLGDTPAGMSVRKFQAWVNSWARILDRIKKRKLAEHQHAHPAY